MAQDRGGLPELLDALRRRWLLAAAVALPLFGGVVFYAQSLPSAYDGEAIVAFSPKPDQDFGADIVRVTLPKYVAYVTARATTDRIAPSIGEATADLRGSVDASVATDTANLTITVRLPTADRAARAANAMAAEVVRFSDGDALLAGQVVSPALPQGQPASPPRKLLMAAGLVVAALAGSATAFVVERGLPRVRTANDVAALTGHPVVGRIPVSRALGRKPAEALADPMVGAAVRTLRTHLERESRARPVHVLAVTSATAGDGKTTVAVTFAAAVARLDARVLLVDADLRRPRVAAAFEIPSAKGFAEVLRGTTRLADAVQRVGIKGLSVLPSQSDPDAGDLLARRFTEVLDEARDSYDVIIVDCPPILVGDDARTLATLADAVLLVVSAGSASGPVSEATAALDALGVRLLGVVVNKVRERVPRYASAYLAGDRV